MSLNHLNLIFVAVLIAGASLPVLGHDEHPKSKPSAAAAGSSQLAEGEVRKIDKEAGKITLRHGPITNLEMPAMSMVFQVKDPAMLDKVQMGDKVRFSAEKAGATFTVTHIEPAK